MGEAKKTTGRLEDWCVIPERILDPCITDATNKVIVGRIFESEHFTDGTRIVTSNLVKIESGFAYTLNSCYELGGGGRIFP